MDTHIIHVIYMQYTHICNIYIYTFDVFRDHFRFSNENKFPGKLSRPKLAGKIDFSRTLNPISTVLY